MPPSAKAGSEAPAPQAGYPAAPDEAQPQPLLIVTRPAGQAAALVAELKAQGVLAQALPLIGISALDDRTALTQAWHALPGFDVVMFVSAHAVQGLFAAQPAGAVWPPSTLAASTGPGTSAALQAAGLAPSQIVQPRPPGRSIRQRSAVAATAAAPCPLAGPPHAGGAR